VRRLLALLLVLNLAWPVQAQTSATPMSTASVVLSVIRIALNLGAGRQDYLQVDVVGEGATPEQARNEGFRVAINQAVGSVVATQTESQRNKLTRDEIVNYSSGFVDRFEIQDQQWAGNRVQVRMRVWVAESRLAHRLLGKSIDHQTVPGDQITAQISTLINERQQGDQLASAVARDFPARSFDVKVIKSNVKFDQYRQAKIEVTVAVGWDQRFTNSVYEVLTRTQDPVKHAWFYQYMNSQEPRLQLSAVDAHGKVLQKQCFEFTLSPSNTGYNVPRRFLLNLIRDQLYLDTGYKLEGILTLNFGQNTQQLEQIGELRVKILSQKEC